jgi:nucleotide-binding universal stress UspA family protein
MTRATIFDAAPTLATGSAVRSGPVIVAVKGRKSVAIGRVGALVAKRLGHEMTVLSLSDSRDMPRALPVDERTGDVPHTLAHMARERQAPLIVMGIGRHRPIDRLLGSDTVLRTVRLSDCPVLAVSRSHSPAPESAAVGIDFSSSSAYAAQSVVPLLTPTATLHLVHVWQPSNASDDDSVRHDDVYRRHLPNRFRRFIASLSLPATIVVKSEVREGRPAERLVDFADAHRVDLIAVGRNGHNIVQRLLVGGVAERVLRSATCSVLIAPDRPLAGLQVFETTDVCVDERIDRRSWETALDGFARRNAGRVVVLETSDPEHGVVSRERGYILFGTSYDEPAHLVLIQLGETNGRRQHRTRYVSDAERLSIARDVRGTDVALRIRHGTADTVLTVLPASDSTKH